MRSSFVEYFREFFVVLCGCSVWLWSVSSYVPFCNTSIFVLLNTKMARGGVTHWSPKGAPGGFVLEGVREDYSGSMSVFPCRGMFRRLAVVGLPAKTRPLVHCTVRSQRFQPFRSGLFSFPSDSKPDFGSAFAVLVDSASRVGTALAL